MDGLLILDKPPALTSRKVVDRAETWFPGVRVGHAGTLDPLATGVLVLCLGQATRLIEYVQRMSKTYAVGIRLGAVSDTDDADGVIQPLPDPPIPTEEDIRRLLPEFVGEMDQVPPAHSAAHVEGRRAYQLARRGREVRLAPRRVRIDRIDLIRYAFPTLELVVDCGKGTYIRSLARDLGQRLGCGGLVSSLQRTRIGPFRVHDALPFDAGADVAKARLRPLRDAVAELPPLTLAEEDMRRLRQGQSILLPQEQSSHLSSTPGEVAVLAPTGELAAVATWNPAKQLLRPEKVIAVSAPG
jgi:tRNA pseudouridine55 synthase